MEEEYAASRSSAAHMGPGRSQAAKPQEAGLQTDRQNTCYSCNVGAQKKVVSIMQDLAYRSTKHCTAALTRRYAVSRMLSQLSSSAARTSCVRGDNMHIHDTKYLSAKNT